MKIDHNRSLTYTADLFSALTYIAVYSIPKEATLYNALTGLSWGVGTILGPVVGGALLREQCIVALGKSGHHPRTKSSANKEI